MSRSRRKRPIVGVTKKESEHDDKRVANRRLRRHTRQRMHVDPTRDVLPLLREVSDVWLMAKDGRMWLDAERHPELLRK